MKQSLLVEADGGPLAIEIAGANVPDAQLLAETIEAIVLERPQPEPDFEPHLYLDKGFDNDTGRGACIDHHYLPHIALVRDERPDRPKTHRSRRWVVERTFAWFSKWRGILIRWEKADNYLGLLQLACGLLWFRRLHHLVARKHDGCLDLAISADSVDPERIYIFERWRDQQSLDAWRKVANPPKGEC